MNQIDGVTYNEDGQILSHSIADRFNKKLIANMNPKTLMEELNVNRSQFQSSHNIPAKKSGQLLSRQHQRSNKKINVS